MDRINTLHFADAGLFLEHLRSLAKKDPSFTYFRGQSKDLPLVPTACRGNGKWTGIWIENFVESNRHEYVRFLDHLKREEESQELFLTRFELALRNYIEHEIVFQFQQFALDKNFVELSAHERVPESSPVRIVDYLSHDGIPLATETRYVELLAQHHGVPTRLLDWTSCLNVALDFAVGGVADPAKGNDRIAVWVVIEWGRKIPSIDEDCDKSVYTMPFTITGDNSIRLLRESPLHGTCLKLFIPPDDSTSEMYIMPHLKERAQGKRDIRVDLDKVSEIYVNEQCGKAMIDMRHDRHFYDNSSFQPMNDRLSECPIPTDKVFKFTLPHSRIPWLRPQIKDLSVRRIYDLPMYDRFDDIEPNREVSQEERRLRREHNFLTEVGRRIRTDIDWDAIQI